MSAKQKTTKEQGVEARSLARSILEGSKGVLEFRDGTRKTSFNYSYRLAQNQHKVVNA